MRRYIREWDAKKAGKKDGRKGHPPPEFDGSNGRYSDFEKQVSDVAERDISRVVGRWRSEETQVLKELKTLVPELHVSFRRFQNQLEVHNKGLDGMSPPSRLIVTGRPSLSFLSFFSSLRGASTSGHSVSYENLGPRRFSSGWRLQPSSPLPDSA
jgi:hypothetical protein